MKNSNILFGLVLILSVILASCDADPSPTPIPYPNIDAFFAVKQAPIQTFSFDVADGTDIILANGTTVDIGNNAICNPDNTPATGTVQVSFKEVFKKSEMLYEQKPTFAGEQILESGGVLNMVLQQGNTKLKLCGNAQLRIPISSETSAPSMMELFIGDETEDGFTWVADSIQAEFWVDSAGYNAFLFSDFEWINCDYFYSETGPKTTLTAVPTASSGSATDVTAFLVFDDINAIAQLQYNSTDNNFVSYANSLPIGLDATVIIIGLSETAFFVGTEDVTITADLEVNVALSEVTEAELEAVIDGLN